MVCVWGGGAGVYSVHMCEGWGGTRERGRHLPGEREGGGGTCQGEAVTLHVRGMGELREVEGEGKGEGMGKGGRGREGWHA